MILLLASPSLSLVTSKIIGVSDNYSIAGIYIDRGRYTLSNNVYTSWNKKHNNIAQMNQIAIAVIFPVELIFSHRVLTQRYNHFPLFLLEPEMLPSCFHFFA
jgi:hypothetical protein